jgi:flagellar protein FlbD
MVTLTRLDGSTVTVNGDRIEWMEESPDTLVTLVSGKKFVVQEPIRKIIAAIDAARVASRGKAGD